MTIEETINQDYISAMKAREADTVATLRLLMSAIKNEAINVGGLGTVLTDEQVLGVLNRQVKQRNDSIAQYEAAGRGELAQKEKAEMAIIEQYMPKGMSDEELASAVEEAISSTGATTRADMGKVMGALKSKLSNPADVSKAAGLVNQKLS